MNKVNNGSSNSIACVEEMSLDSNSSFEEEINFPNIRINIGNLQNFGNINLNSNFKYYLANFNGYISNSQTNFLSNYIEEDSDNQDDFSEEERVAESESNYDEGMNEQEKNEIKEKIINNFNKIKFINYCKKKNNIKQEYV